MYGQYSADDWQPQHSASCGGNPAIAWAIEHAFHIAPEKWPSRRSMRVQQERGEARPWVERFSPCAVFLSTTSTGGGTTPRRLRWPEA
jgi:hypothetical protein